MRNSADYLIGARTDDQNIQFFTKSFEGLSEQNQEEILNLIAFAKQMAAKTRRSEIVYFSSAIIDKYCCNPEGFADLNAGYLRIQNNKGRYVKLDGTVGTDRETHFKIKTREEM